nr:MAG TPA: hypothetical protein [Bacteriophage sp.]
MRAPHQGCGGWKPQETRVTGNLPCRKWGGVQGGAPA